MTAKKDIRTDISESISRVEKFVEAWEIPWIASASDRRGDFDLDFADISAVLALAKKAAMAEVAMREAHKRAHVAGGFAQEVIDDYFAAQKVAKHKKKPAKVKGKRAKCECRHPKRVHRFGASECRHPTCACACFLPAATPASSTIMARHGLKK